VEGTAVFGADGGLDMVGQPTTHHRQSYEYDDLKDIWEDDVDGTKCFDYSTDTSSEVEYN